MAYTINHYDQSQVTVIADGTIDNTLDIKLIGKNYAGYGEVQNENLVFLLENFASATPGPAKPIRGQIWFDIGASKLKFYDENGKWRTTGGAEVTTGTRPTGLSTGDFWFNETNEQLYAYVKSRNDYVLIGPQAVAGSGTTQMISRSLLDDQDQPHAIIEAVVDDVTVYIISSDTFTLKTPNTPAGFTVIKTGLTLPYTPGSGVNSGVTSTDVRFWGTATNADKLGGVSAENFVQAGDANFNSQVHFGDIGYLLGNDNRLRVFIDSGTPVVQNLLSTDIVFKTKVSGNEKTPLKLSGSDMLPGADGVSKIGSESFQFANVYSNLFTGPATKANSLQVGNDYRTASIASSSNTVPVRDADGFIFASEFHGTATAAYFADLAEKYLADADYEVGTVVAVGGEKEVTASNYGDLAIGVVSANPAFKMNSELEGGTYIALKGRVPVKVTGAVRKGQRLVAANNGTAVAAVPHANDVFAVALESNDAIETKLIECVIL
jgi:hypothetical protein